MWMIKQAREQGGLPEAAIDHDEIKDEGLNEIANPVVHDEIGNDPGDAYVVPNYEPERTFRYLDEGQGSDVPQNEYTTPYESDLTYEKGVNYLEDNIYHDNKKDLHKTELTKNDDGQTPYVQWLQANYGLLPDSPYGIAIESGDGDE